MKKILLLALVSIATNTFAQTLVFQNGQKLEVTTQIQKNSSLEIMGQAIESKVTATLNEIFDVKTAESNAITLEHKVKRLVFNAESMQGGQSFDSEKEGDRKGQFGKMLEKTLKNKYTVTLDGTGKVTAVKLDDDNPRGKEEADALVDMLAIQTGLNLAAPKAGDPSEFKILQNREVKQGETWKETSASPIGKTTTNYTVKSVTDTEINLDFTEETLINGTQQVMGTEAAMNGVSKSTGTAVVDKATGILKTKTANIDSDITIGAQGMTMPVKEKATRTVTVKPA